jgi:hypothetical protein
MMDLIYEPRAVAVNQNDDLTDLWRGDAKDLVVHAPMGKAPAGASGECPKKGSRTSTFGSP